eukprot:CAMPEP_0201541022 /NCGR_PEP_ID=MMETSP0161_2-20130828/71255_1 /ASSEMBLY_ACC=CAM_ASM_000251 /TAXON_ID=180227 /ORGANISM="Neoparamoeba aestuarina, Strain SoJaBio B1-5/56/2" /LENGTH=171 /DNA_ID=CAMNT_0047948527 /DNA_START=23 /DNA_END=538 /DNA_ORIENTATION=+
MAKLFFALLVCVAVAHCFEVTKTANPLQSGDVEVVLTLSKSSGEQVSNLVFHDSTPIHVEVKEGELVGKINDFHSSTTIRYIVEPVQLELGLAQKTINVELPPASISYKGAGGEDIQVKSNSAVASFSLNLPKGNELQPELIGFIALALPVLAAVFFIRVLPKEKKKEKKK